MGDRAERGVAFRSGRDGQYTQAGAGIRPISADRRRKMALEAW
ncbi:hypothetical protein [Nonomuraea sp. NPDC049400]